MVCAAMESDMAFFIFSNWTEIYLFDAWNSQFECLDNDGAVEIQILLKSALI